jgi:hypothetical protein
MLTTTSSALSAAESAFALLTCQPAPLVFDARAIPDLPDHAMPLDELRDLLLAHRFDAETTDALWRQLAYQAREWGPEWVVGAVGIALPGLTGMAAKIRRGYPGGGDDVDSELLTGFLHALRTLNLWPPRLWLRLCWAAWRAGVSVLPRGNADELPPELPTGSRSPARPYGHPDLVLGRAAAAGIITGEQAEQIGATRFGDVLIEELAGQLGIAAPVLRMRRRRAELQVAAALARGDLTMTTRRPPHPPATVVAGRHWREDRPENRIGPLTSLAASPAARAAQVLPPVRPHRYGSLCDV